MKFAPEATEEQFQAIVKNNTLSQKVHWNGKSRYVKGGDFNTLVLEVSSSREVLNSLKAKKEIASATYLLEHDGYLSAITDEFLVKIKEGTSHAQLHELAEKNNCTVSEREWFGGGVAFVISVPNTSDMDAIGMANLFYETGLFESAAPNFFHFNALSSFDAHYGDQWNLKSTGQYGSSVDINVEQAWAITQGSPNIKIAVIDTGVDLTHPDLQANLLAGYDATGGGSAGAYVYNNGWGNNVNNSHGTAVAGIIGAIKDNGIGVSGIAPGCKIIPIRAGYGEGMSDSWAIAALDWARTRADVINCSWSFSNPIPMLSAKIDQVASQGRVVGGVAKGCVIVFATGNDNLSTIKYPASLFNVIAVGAASYNGQRKSLSTPDGEQWGSHYGSGLEVVAPGVLIPTTDIQGWIGYNSDWAIHTDYGGSKRLSDYTTDPNYTAWFGGTSAAAPQVAGIAALLLSKNPNLTRAEVEHAINSTAENMSMTWDREIGYGLVNAYDALLLLGDGTPLKGGTISASPAVITSCPANGTSLINVVKPSGGSSLLRYQWQISFNNGSSWFDLLRSTLSMGLGQQAVSGTTLFRRKVTSGSETAYSNVQTVTVLNETYGGTISGDATISPGSSTGMGSVSHGADPDLSFYWEQSYDGISWIFAPGNSNTYNYQTPPLYQTTHYRLRITEGGISGPTGYSNTISVIVR